MNAVEIGGRRPEPLSTIRWDEAERIGDVVRAIDASRSPERLHTGAPDATPDTMEPRNGPVLMDDPRVRGATDRICNQIAPSFVLEIVPGTAPG